MPEVRVIMPTYNAAGFLRQTLGRVLRQTYADWELVVVDDASIGGTIASLERLRDPRLRLVHNYRRLGLVGNWNRCRELVSGEYISIFH